MELGLLSNAFDARRLGEEDAELIYNLCVENEIFYQYHPPLVTRESVLEDMAALPPGKDYDDKFFIGFFDGEALAAIMDLILDYPAKGACFIGLFMMNREYQHKGVGSEIIRDCAAYLRSLGFGKIRLGVDKNNPQSNAFWKKNGFTAVDEDRFIIMELPLRHRPDCR